MLKVAFASNDRARVNQHFGATSGFAIYAIDAAHAQLVEVAEFEREPDAAGSDAYACAPPPRNNENRLAEKIAALDGCAAVYCLAVGGAAVRQLLACGIQPVRLEAETSIAPLLVGLSKALRDGGIAWVDQRARRAAGDRFERMAAEGWQE